MSLKGRAGKFSLPRLIPRSCAMTVRGSLGGVSGKRRLRGRGFEAGPAFGDRLFDRAGDGVEVVVDPDRGPVRVGVGVSGDSRHDAPVLPGVDPDEVLSPALRHE